VLSVLSDRGGAFVIRFADVVVKAHPADVDVDALRSRLAVAVGPELSELLVPPLAGGEVFDAAGRAVTVWPAGEPVARDDPDAAPWEAAATLLARLHAAPARLPRRLPPAGAPARVAKALARMRGVAAGSRAAAVVERAVGSLPPLPAGKAALLHGDWHLGQLVRGAGGVPGWRLVDVDDLGFGDPVWDLARPAALFAAGTLDPGAWYRFLDAYRAAGGCAVPEQGDPWPALDVAARALAVQLAASGVADAADAGRAPDDFEAALLDACRRIAGAAGVADVS
jgi:Ser/Thr protein kinase RdoA (MazF antagonist)